MGRRTPATRDLPLRRAVLMRVARGFGGAGMPSKGSAATMRGRWEIRLSPRALRPYLEHTLRVSPSELVFPREDGSMYAENTHLEMVLRRAFRKAGLVSSYRHKCRKPGCGYIEAAADPSLRECPRHKKNRRLWVTSVVRPTRFYDLRHTTGSLLTMRGASTRFV